MDYHILLDLVSELGYRLAMCGAETFRVEQSINMIMQSYGIVSEAFAIPNCLTISIVTKEGYPMTRMRRIGQHGNDLDSVERYSNLSRRICTARPDPQTAMQWLKEANAARIAYSLPVFLLGNFLGASGFAIFFGGSIIDSLCAGICGMIVGLINKGMDKLHANQFFSTIIAAFTMAITAYTLGAVGLADNADAITIGTLMILLPGLIFTNAMRDIIYGDTNSGVNRIVQVFLIAVAVALGTATAWESANAIWGMPDAAAPLPHGFWMQELGCLIGCIGFSILFNIHGPGGLLCTLGGILSWAVYLIAEQLGTGSLTAYFFAALFASIYSEIMARIRKYPAISYLVVSIFPLIPGASIYYTTQSVLQGDLSRFASIGFHTIGIAGFIAVGILIASTIFRLWSIARTIRR